MQRVVDMFKTPLALSLSQFCSSWAEGKPHLDVSGNAPWDASIILGRPNCCHCFCLRDRPRSGWLVGGWIWHALHLLRGGYRCSHLCSWIFLPARIEGCQDGWGSRSFILSGIVESTRATGRDLDIGWYRMIRILWFCVQLLNLFDCLGCCAHFPGDMTLPPSIPSRHMGLSDNTPFPFHPLISHHCPR